MLVMRLRTLVATSAMLLGLLGVLAGATASPEPGVGLAADEELVSEILPGSPAWRDGIRAGHEVVELADSTEPKGWGLQVRDETGIHGSSYDSHLTRLRSALPGAVLGSVVLAIALVAMLRGYTLGGAAIPLALVVATAPLVLTGNIRDSILGGSLSIAIGGFMVALMGGSSRGRLLVLSLGVIGATAWITAVLLAPAMFEFVDRSRLPAGIGLSGWAVWLSIDRRRIAEYLNAPGSPTPFDVLYVPLVGAVLAAGVLFAAVPVPIAVVVAVVTVAAYPHSRRAASRSFERLFVGRVRREAEIHAVEFERGRLAREIHDAPLQELSAVIRRLDAHPDVATETSLLRGVAAHLRDVATGLQPPELEDLGLAAALEDLGDAIAAAHPDWLIELEVDDLVVDGGRPAADVETAAYRVTQEAAANALRHSNGRTLRILASIASEAIDITIEDDGQGLKRNAALKARRQGHFGLDAMRDRAEAVNARFTLTSEAGTTVRFHWEVQQ